MKKTLVIGLAALVTGSAATAGEFSFSSELTFASKYIFRGIQYGDNSLQPAIEVAWDEFYAGVWAQQPLENRSSMGWGDEIDIYAGWAPKLSDAVSLDLGAMHYYYPNGDATTEAFVGANFTLNNFVPGIYAYYDFDLEVFTVRGNIGTSIPLDQMGTSLDLAATAGSVSPDEGESYSFYGVDVTLPFKLNEHATFKVGLSWATHSLDGVDDDHLWYTAGLNVTF